jgi:transposase
MLAPVRLPQRLDGTCLDHLSASSLAQFWRCSESWRARYLGRVRGPESAELRPGWVVDAAIEAHYKALLATGEALPQRDIEDIYAAAWQRRIDDAAIDIDWATTPPSTSGTRG